MGIFKTASAERREKLRKEFWDGEAAWTGMDEKGWFKAPRTIPLIMTLLRMKEVRGNTDPTQVYLELLSRHMDGGVIEMVHEGEHAFAAGCTGARGIRTWQERMRILEKLGFIKIKASGNQQYKYVFLVHPTTAVQRLRESGKIPNDWWDTYCARQIETKERSYKDRQEQAKQAAKVVSLASRKSKLSVGRK